MTSDPESSADTFATEGSYEVEDSSLFQSLPARWETLEET